ncbi:hypothetical protein BCR44DRAFT_220623 [Catenaria anguillulae PL171]|uniref:Uncharacterized protein n=1 Tax=Catenaria anguillulae PL171 TaxID=765915 RepID=A0A1Y2H9Z1_9FUNG|nr:hypothetical protein BCR44DRAFT_220623 [Catenaria anguillulae PL171]
MISHGIDGECPTLRGANTRADADARVLSIPFSATPFLGKGCVGYCVAGLVGCGDEFVIFLFCLVLLFRFQSFSPRATIVACGPLGRLCIFTLYTFFCFGGHTRSIHGADRMEAGVGNTLCITHFVHFSSPPPALPTPQQSCMDHCTYPPYIMLKSDSRSSDGQQPAKTDGQNPTNALLWTSPSLTRQAVFLPQSSSLLSSVT